MTSSVGSQPPTAKKSARRKLRGYTTGETSPRRAATGRLDHKVVRETLKTHRLGRREYRRDPDLLRAAAPAHEHLKPTNMLERLNEAIRRRTHVVRIFPNGESWPALPLRHHLALQRFRILSTLRLFSVH
jgi:hypothetical protein